VKTVDVENCNNTVKTTTHSINIAQCCINVYKCTVTGLYYVCLVEGNQSRRSISSVYADM